MFFDEVSFFLLIFSHFLTLGVKIAGSFYDCRSVGVVLLPIAWTTTTARPAPAPSVYLNLHSSPSPFVVDLMMHSSPSPFVVDLIITGCACCLLSVLFLTFRSNNLFDIL